MMIVNIQDAKIHLAELLNQALEGDEIIISIDNKPLARLVPYAEDIQPRKGGQFKGLIHISDDFDAPLSADILKDF